MFIDYIKKIKINYLSIKIIIKKYSILLILINLDFNVTFY
jgi:hypothetical protein